MRPDINCSVLVVEDDPNHGLLISLAFQQAAPNAKVHLTGRAEEAITYLVDLMAAAKSVQVGLPDIIVSDIDMPGIGGFGLLQWLGHQPDRVRDIPVVVFTSSDDPLLAQRCYSLGAREVKAKSGDFRELVELVGYVLQRGRTRKQGGAGLSP